jgi:3-deoxy-D-manno-octulosonic-acid transferase
VFRTAASAMLRLLYSTLWYPALPFALFASRSTEWHSARERLGLGAPALADSEFRIWIHLASVGEVEAIQSIARRLLRDVPHAAVVLSAMTPAGRDVARRRISTARACVLAPFDCPSCVRAFLRRVRPQLVIVTETELWPNYFLQSRRIGAKIAIVNGRMSERSAARYGRLRSLFEPALKSADLVMVQSADDAARFASLGVAPERLVVTGNTKFDPDAGVEAPIRRELMGFAKERPILIAGSTAQGEEEVVLRAFAKLRAEFPALALIVAPRHLARVPEVEGAVSRAGFDYVKASSCENGQGDVMIVDTMGELRAIYRRASIAFVGGSLTSSRGGQNPAEPAAVRVPVMFGPYYENQRETAEALLAAGGAKVITNSEEMARVASNWLRNDESRIAAGRSARECIERLSGGVSTSLMRLKGLINLG